MRLAVTLSLIVATVAMADSVWVKDGAIIARPVVPDTCNPSVAMTEARSGAKCVELPKCEPKYWVITAASIAEMKADDKASVDAAAAQKEADAIAAQAAVELAAQEAAQAEADKLAAERADIVKAFPDEKQAGAIGMLFDRIIK